MNRQVRNTLIEMGFEVASPDSFPTPIGTTPFVANFEFARPNCQGCIYVCKFEAILGCEMYENVGLSLEMLTSVGVLGCYYMPFQSLYMTLNKENDLVDLKKDIVRNIDLFQRSFGLECVSGVINKVKDEINGQ